MRYFKEFIDSEKKRIFHITPKEFNKSSKISLLRYSVGALLYIPAINKKMLNNFADNRIKDLTSVSICLEDSMGESGETEAIENMRQAFCSLKVNIKNNIFTEKDLPLIFIRPKNTEQMMKFRDVLEENSDLITGIIIPKADSTVIEEFLKAIDRVGCTDFYIMPIIETSEFTDIIKKYDALTELRKTIKKYKDRILNIRIGVTDILGSYSLRRNKKYTIYDNIVFNKFAGDLLSIFGADNLINIPISGGVSEFYDMKNKEILDSYLKEIDIDKLNGFIGKTVIHPFQMKAVQAKSVISYEDYEDAKSIVSGITNKYGVSAGYTRERMNEVNPHLKWAEKTIMLSNIYGVFKEGMDYNDILRLSLQN